MLNFNFYSSAKYWLAFLVIIIFLRLLGSGQRARKWLLIISSSLMLLAIPEFAPIDLAILIVLSILSFAVGYFLRSPVYQIKPIHRLLISSSAILFALLFLSFYKYDFVQRIALNVLPFVGRGPHNIIRMIGVSYFTFKIIHFIVESYRSKTENLSLVTYLNYMVFFPSFISGPINRYNHFAESLEKHGGHTAKADVKAGAERIVHGLFKKFVLVQLLYPHILTNASATLVSLSFHEVVLGLYAYAFYFYFDFSGYTDLAVGCARIMGIDLPENFRNPFLKKNIRELWTNWHMSLTAWLVDYIYWPVVRKLRNREVFRSHPILLSNIGMMITFIICGMWHGEGLNFIVWGAYHGLGISIATIYQREKRKVRNPRLQRYFRSRISAAVGIIATFNFFALGLTFFVLDWENLRAFIIHFSSLF